MNNNNNNNNNRQSRDSRGRYIPTKARAGIQFRFLGRNWNLFGKKNAGSRYQRVAGLQKNGKQDWNLPADILKGLGRWILKAVWETKKAIEADWRLFKSELPNKQEVYRIVVECLYVICIILSVGIGIQALNGERKVKFKSYRQVESGQREMRSGQGEMRL